MKTAFSTLGCPDWKWSDIVSTAKDMGFDGFEVRGVGNVLYAPDIKVFSDDKINETVDRLHSLNVEISCLTSACFLYEDSEQMTKEGKAYIDLAEKLGVKYIRLMGDRHPEPAANIDDETVIRNALALSDYAMGKNVVLLIESNGVYADTKRLSGLLERIDRDNVAALWDINHPFRYFGETPEETFNNIGKYVKYVHLKDSKVENGSIKYKMMGYGDIPLKDILSILKQNGYEGYLSLEWVKRWYSDLEDAGVVFLQYLSYIRRTIASLR